MLPNAPTNVKKTVSVHYNLSEIPKWVSPTLAEILVGASELALVDVIYRDAVGSTTKRRVEPYALRRTVDGDLLLQAVDLTRNAELRNFRVDRLLFAEISSERFEPRYRMELFTEIDKGERGSKNAKRERVRLPTSQEIDELVAFLPLLYAEGFDPVKEWKSGSEEPFRDGTLITAGWPVYNDTVEEFRRVASQESCWVEYYYLPGESVHFLARHDLIRTAGFDRLRSALTHCIRVERFCTGAMVSLIKDGDIRRILERLAELRTIAEPRPSGRTQPVRIPPLDG